MHILMTFMDHPFHLSKSNSSFRSQPPQLHLLCLDQKNSTLSYLNSCQVVLPNLSYCNIFCIIVPMVLQIFFYYLKFPVVKPCLFKQPANSDLMALLTTASTGLAVAFFSGTEMRNIGDLKMDLNVIWKNSAIFLIFPFSPCLLLLQLPHCSQHHP